MEKLTRLAAATALALLVLMGQATAATITFNEVAQGSVDPTIGNVSFFSGDGTALNDTYVDDFWTPGNNYLMSGFNDGTNPNGANHWQTYFIGATLNQPGYRFNTISFDVVAESVLPGKRNNILFAFINSNGAGLGSNVYFDEFDTNFKNVSLSNSLDYDYFGIFSWNSLNESDVDAGYFDIDNFTYTTKLIDQGNPQDVVPEPSTVALLGMGLAGFAIWRRNRG